MLPSELKAESFERYPPDAGALARSYLSTLQKLPLAFLPLLLREVIAYDRQFPAEKTELRQQLLYLHGLSPAQMSQSMAPFFGLQLPGELEQVDWVNSPEVFTAQLSAILWTTSQQDRFTAASENYIKSFYTWKAPASLPRARVAMVAIGSGVAETDYPLFRKLRRQGTYYTQVRSKDGVRFALDALSGRARAIPAPFDHWYIGGGEDEVFSGSNVTQVSYGSLAVERRSLLEIMRRATQSAGGPEAMHAQLIKLRPEDIGLNCGGPPGTESLPQCDAVLSYFKMNILTQGSGTQIFSTSFVEWTAREAMRRAQPITMFARFTPRQRSVSLDAMIAGNSEESDVDPQGSLIDADMGAYYIWLNQRRLAQANTSSFLAWFEEHGTACCISPEHPPGTESSEPVDLAQLVSKLCSS